MHRRSRPLAWAAAALGSALFAGPVHAGPGDTPALASPDAAERLLLDVAASGSRIVAVGEQGHIVISDDAGSTWSHAQVPVSLMLTGVTFSGDARAWAVGHDGLVLTSEDAGATWQVALDGTDIAAMQIDAADAAIARIEAELDAMDEDDPAREEIGYALEDAQFDREDAEAVADTGITTPLLGVRFTGPAQGYAYGAYGVLLETRDAGASWALASNRLDNPDNQHLYAIDTMRSGALLLVGEAGAAFRSEDGGTTWERLDVGYTPMGCAAGSSAPTMTAPAGAKSTARHARR